EQLEHLQRFEYETGPLKKLPEGIKKLDKLEYLEIRETSLSTFPVAICQLEKLTQLSMPFSKIKSIPEEIALLKNLESLDLRGAQITHLPKSFGQLKHLKYLSLDENSFSSFPMEVCQCLNLSYLRMSENNLDSLPEEIQSLKAISWLDLSENKFKVFPEVLLEWNNTFGQAATHYSFYVDPSLYNNVRLRLLFEKSFFRDLSRVDKKYHFGAYINDKKRLKKIPQTQLRNLINSKITEVSDNTVKFLTEKNKESISNGAIVFNGIKTLKGLSKIREELKVGNVQVLNKYDSKVTHILIKSKGNKDFSNLPEKEHWKWITESQLRKYIDKINPGYLVEESFTDLDHVSDLILSLDENNMALALEIISGGGIPDDLLTHLFIVHKMSDEKQTRKKAGDMLRKKGNIEIQKVLRMRSMIRFDKSYFFSDDIRNTCEKIDQFTENGAFDKGLIAYAVSKKYNFNHGYALNFAKSEHKKELLTQVIENNVFELSYYESDFIEFPKELCDFKDLVKIRFHINSGQWKGSKFKRNNKFEVPEEIKNLTKLKELALLGPITHFPVHALAEMKELKSLLIRNSDLHKKGISKEQLAKQLPNCKIQFS
ncbi:MAG: leucine-rich repeat domain-containing protein, partial [Flavobacteriales bacterium]|nr:leucine-rich repeat domain-containing protein [Flavobacteriales bacterium]